MPFSELTTEPLSLDAVLAQVRSPRNGGYVTFSGDVRDHDAGQSVQAIEYQAYDELARKELARIAGEAETRWPGTLCAVAHRIGRLTVGESSVVIAAGSPHRAEAFAACRWIIDTLKTSVPIWKREEYVAPEHCAVWIEGTEQMPAAHQD